MVTNWLRFRGAGLGFSKIFDGPSIVMKVVSYVKKMPFQPSLQSFRINLLNESNRLKNKNLSNSI